MPISRKKLDFNHTPITTTNFQKVAYSATPSLKKCNGLLVIIFYLHIFNFYNHFNIAFSIIDNASTPNQATHSNTKSSSVSHHQSQSTFLSPLNSPNNNFGLKYSKYNN